MELNYFKTTYWGDCYVLGEDYSGIIKISEDDFCLMGGDDDSVFEGFYKPLKVSKEDCNKLREFAEKGDRKQGTTLLRKIHEENSGVLGEAFLMSKLRGSKTANDPELEKKWVRHAFDAKPILD